MSVDLLFQQAVSAHKANRLAEAEMLYRAMLERTPLRPEAGYNLGLLQLQRGQAEAGVATLRTVVEADPATERYGAALAEGLLIASQSHRTAGRIDASIACLQAAITLKPDFTTAYHNLGDAFLAGQQTEAAAATWLRVQQLIPANAQAAAHMARIRRQLLFQQQTRNVFDLFRREGIPPQTAAATDDNQRSRLIAARLTQVGDYFTGTVTSFGQTHWGISANSADYHSSSLKQMAAFVAGAEPGWTINDIGCGYGALFGLIRDGLTPYGVRYQGYDISPGMVAEARKRYADDPRHVFVLSSIPLWPADYSVAAGTFNLNFEHDQPEWLDYIRAQILLMARMSRCGFSFNALRPEYDRQDTNLIRLNSDAVIAFITDFISDRIELITNYSEIEWTIRVYAPYKMLVVAERTFSSENHAGSMK